MARAGPQLVTTGHPPPGETAGLVLLLTGQLFTRRGSLGLLWEIAALLVAMVTVEFKYGVSALPKEVEVSILRSDSSFAKNCSLFLSGSSLCG